MICSTDYMCEIWDPSCPLFTYAQLESGFEGTVHSGNEERIILEFYGVRVSVDHDDFEDGTFFIPVPRLRIVE